MARLLICIIGLLAVMVHGADFRDNKFKINLSYDDTRWQSQSKKDYRDRLVLSHVDQPVTLHLRTYRFSETTTANRLVELRVQSTYDGWQLIKQKELSGFQTLKKNVHDGIQSLYKKTHLDEQLNESHEFVAEICLTTDDTLAIILTLSVDSLSTLLSIKDEFNQVADALWYGDEKPQLHYVASKQNEWLRHQQNATRRRFYDTDAAFQPPLRRIHHQLIGPVSNHQPPSVYSNQNGDYVLSNNQLTFISAVDQQMHQVSLSTIKDPMIELVSDGVNVIQRTPMLRIKKYDLQLNERHTIQDDEAALDVVTVNGATLVLGKKRVRLITNDTTHWSFDYSFRSPILVADQDRLIIGNRQDVLFLDLNTGELIQRIPIKTLLPALNGTVIDLVLHRSTLFITTKKGRQFAQIAIDIHTKEVIDKMVRGNLSSFSVIGMTHHAMVVQYRTTMGQSVLEAMDANTFASIWTHPFDDGYAPILINQHVLFINKMTHQLVSRELSLAAKMASFHVIDQLPPPPVVASTPSPNNATTEEAVSDNPVDDDPIPNEALPPVDARLIAIQPLQSRWVVLIEQDDQLHMVYLRP